MSGFSHRFSMLARLVGLASVLSFCLFVSAGSTPAQSKVPNHARVKQNDASTILSLSDFGAVGDGVADDSPALQQALDALANSGGGTLQVPAGHYALRSAVLKQFAPGTSVTIAGEPSETVIDVAGNGVGLDLTSEFIVAVGESNDALSLSGLDSLQMKD